LTTAITNDRLWTVHDVAAYLGLWTVHDVAAYLGVPVETLYAWRKRGYGPIAHRVGRHLRYDSAAVRGWFTELDA
jgi:excisionase family DNA binding protein